MIRYNTLLKLSYGIAVSLTFGLSGCYMDDQNSTPAANTPESNLSSNAEAAPKAVQKSYASKEPTQEATPGPKRTAAPQLPVIQ